MLVFTVLLSHLRTTTKKQDKRKRLTNTINLLLKREKIIEKPKYKLKISRNECNIQSKQMSISSFLNMPYHAFSIEQKIGDFISINYSRYVKRIFSCKMQNEYMI